MIQTPGLSVFYVYFECVCVCVGKKERGIEHGGGGM